MQILLEFFHLCLSREVVMGSSDLIYGSGAFVLVRIYSYSDISRG